MLNRILYQQVSRVVDSRARAAKYRKENEMAMLKLDEQKKKDDLILSARKERFKEKIEITDSYLRNKVYLSRVFHSNIEKIHKFRERYDSLTSYERTYSQFRGPDIFLTTPQMGELKNLLRLTHDDYVPHHSREVPSEKTTIGYLIDCSPIIKEIRAELHKYKVSISVDTSSPNWCFPIYITDL